MSYLYKMNNVRKRNWCGTCNNWTEEQLQAFKDLPSVYIIIGSEHAPTTGTPHLQFYFELKAAKTRTALQKIIPKTTFIACNGSAADNQEYTSKESVIYEHGKPKQQGERVDIALVAESIISGEATLDEITLTSPHIYHQYGRTLSRVEDLVMRRKFRTEQTTCDWLVGPTGCGKSHRAYAEFNPLTHYNWVYDNGWQDAYAQQDTVIINEFRGQIPYSELLSLIDKWPHSVRRRGREPMPFMSKHIIITSPLAPEETYKNLSQHDDLAQLNRRITMIYLGKRT